MSLVIVLDTGPLGMLTHAKANVQNEAAVRWLARHLAVGTEVAVPEICDYELRRKLLHKDFSRSVEALDELEGALVYLSLTTAVMRRAAKLWAQMRREGRPTAPPEALDGDVILCALALEHSERTKNEVVVATTNVDHLDRMVAAKRWEDL